MTPAQPWACPPDPAARGLQPRDDAATDELWREILADDGCEDSPADPPWDQVDPETDPLNLCLSALEEGFEVLLDRAQGTPLRHDLERLEGLLLVIAERVRSGDPWERE